MEYIAVLIIGGIILIGTALAYFIFGNFLPGFSGSNADWASYGSYFGGVAGPLLSFLSAMLVIYTIRQQRKAIEVQSSQLRSLEEENVKQDILRYLNKIEENISILLGRQILVSNNTHAEIGDIVDGIESHRAKEEKIYSAAMEKLSKLTFTYCEALALYRDNIDAHFIYRAHHQKASDLVAHLEKEKQVLSANALIMLGFCKLHLEGKNSA